MRSVSLTLHIVVLALLRSSFDFIKRFLLNVCFISNEFKELRFLTSRFFFPQAILSISLLVGDVKTELS